jgi:hypothetical protein
MGARLATVALCLAGATAHAQSANDSGSRLESCIQAARLADAVCSKIPNDPMPRADCFAKARASQLECLDRVLSDAPAETAPPGALSETTRPEPPAEPAPPETSAEQRPASNQADQTDQRDVSVGGTPADEAAKPSNAEAEPVPASPAEVAAKQLNIEPEPPPASLPAPTAEAPTGAIGSTASATSNDRPAPATEWIISETTSPVDYSPLVTAVVRATLNTQDGPDALTVRCRARHTELSLQTTGVWRPRRGNELLVDHQINDRPVVRQPWSLSADGKTATYKNDSAELLRSIPEGATLKVNVADKSGVRLAATFELSGLSVIRQKVGAACKQASLTARTSSDKP